MTPTQLLTELERTDGILPGEALSKALQKPEESVPVLLTILEKSINDVEKILKEEDYFGHIYAMFLLAQLRESNAYPLITQFFSLPEEITWELTGDILTEDLGRILASISCGNTSLIKQMIENSNLESLIRAAAIDALVILFNHQELEHSALISYFQDLYRHKLEKENSMVWNHLVVSSINIFPEELATDIQNAYRQNLIDEDFVSYISVDEALSSGKESVLDWLRQNPDYSLVTDAIRDICKWVS